MSELRRPWPIRIAIEAIGNGIGYLGLAILIAPDIAQDIADGLSDRPATPPQERALIFRTARNLRNAIRRR